MWYCDYSLISVIINDCVQLTHAPPPRHGRVSLRHKRYLLCVVQGTSMCLFVLGLCMRSRSFSSEMHAYLQNKNNNLISELVTIVLASRHAPQRFGETSPLVLQWPAGEPQPPKSQLGLALLATAVLFSLNHSGHSSRDEEPKRKTIRFGNQKEKL